MVVFFVQCCCGCGCCCVVLLLSMLFPSPLLYYLLLLLALLCVVCGPNVLCMFLGMICVLVACCRGTVAAYYVECSVVARETKQSHTRTYARRRRTHTHTNGMCIWDTSTLVLTHPCMRADINNHWIAPRSKAPSSIRSTWRPA
jgi:hypothetical protein